MADDDTTTTQQDPGTATEPADDQQPLEVKKDSDLPPEVRRALNKANKEAETLRLKLREYEDRDKTEQQRLVERAEAAERQLAEQQAESMRARVAIQKGLPAELVDRLRGDDEAALADDADRLIALLQPGKPRGDVAQGPRGDQTDALNGDPLLNDLKAKLGIA